MVDAFKMADEVLLQGVAGITDLINVPGMINTDFADVKMVMSNAGSAIMGIGRGSGEGRAVNAARHAITSPLLEASIEGARGILLNIAGGPDLTLFEVNEAAAIIHDSAHPDANIIFGQVLDDSMGDQVRVTVIAAGFDRFEGQSDASRQQGRPARHAQPAAPKGAPQKEHRDSTPPLGSSRPLMTAPGERPATGSSAESLDAGRGEVSLPEVFRGADADFGDDLDLDDDFDVPSFLK
jgi:cell division protein FtsZ